MGDEKQLRESFRRFSVTAKANKTAEILLYDQIGESFWGGGTSAKQFAEQLKAIEKVDSITLRINSPGGDVFEGAAMYDLISQSAIPVDVIVDGLAASAAFTVAMAGRSISIGEAGMMMTHNARGMTFGTAKDMQSTADLLDKISNQMAELYAKRSGMPVADVKALMDAETWMTPDECVAKGFANKIIKSASDAEPTTMVAAAFDLEKAYQHVPQSLKHQVAIAACAKSLQVSDPRSAKEQHIMATEPVAIVAAVEVIENYGPIAAEIMKLGKEYNVDVTPVIAAQDSLNVAKTYCADRVLERSKTRAVTAGVAEPVVDGMSQQEKREYSMSRVILSLADSNNYKADLERKVSDSIAKEIGRQPKGMYIPTRGLARPNPTMSGLDTKTNAAGKYTVATEIRDLIDLFRNRLKLMALGAQVLSGLNGNIAFPRQLTGSAGSWVAENPGSDVAQSDATFGQLNLTPKTYQATTAFSRQLLAQSTIDVENFVRNDLAIAHALAVDLAGINGSGSSNQPLGLLRTSGIGSVAVGTNGGAPTYELIVDLETAVADANADEASMAFLTTPIMRGKLKKTTILSNTVGRPVWDQTANAPGVGDVIGYPGYVSKQVPAALVKGTSSDCHAIIFGYWPTVLIGEWGVIDLVVDPYALKKQGLIEVTSFQMVDVGVRQPAQIAAIQDARNV